MMSIYKKYDDKIRDKIHYDYKYRKNKRFERTINRLKYKIMNTKIVMTSSALLLAGIGILFSFSPNEVMEYLNIESNTITILFLNLLSALYLGFGLLNWMAKGTLIGGVYNRPIAIGNLMHFGVGAIALVKVVTTIQSHSKIVISLTVVYVIFAILFAYIFIKHPTKIENKKQS